MVGDSEVKEKLTFSDQMYEGPHINALVAAFLHQRNTEVYQSSFKTKTFETNYACKLIVVSSQEALEEKKEKSGFKNKQEIILSNIGGDQKLHYMQNEESVEKEISEAQYNQLTQLAKIREFHGIATGKDANTQHFPQALLHLENDTEKFESKRIKITETKDGKYTFTYTDDKNQQKTIDLENIKCEKLIGYVDRQYGFEIDESIKDELEKITDKTLFGENGYELIEKKVLVNKTFEGHTGLFSVLNPIKNDLKAGDAGNAQVVNLEGHINDLISGWLWEVQQYFKENPSTNKSVTGLMPLCINHNLLYFFEQNHWVLLVIDIDQDQNYTLKIKDSKAVANLGDSSLKNLKSALEKSFDNIKIYPTSNQNISKVNFAKKDTNDPYIQQGNYCGGHVYRMMRDYIDNGDFFKTQKDKTKSHTVLREADYNLIQQYINAKASDVSEENIEYFNKLYGFKAEAVVAKDYIKTSRSSDPTVSPSRQAQVIPMLFRNKDVRKFLDSLIVSADTSDSEGNEAAPAAGHSINTQYFSKDQEKSQSALTEALEAFNGDQGRSELGGQIQSKQSDISSAQDAKKVTATLKNFSNRQIAYSNVSKMTNDQYKQAVLLSLNPYNPTAKLIASSTNWSVLIMFATAVGRVNKLNGKDKISLDIEKMKQKPSWKLAENEFNEKYNKTTGTSDFEKTLVDLATGEPFLGDDSSNKMSL